MKHFASPNFGHVIEHCRKKYAIWRTKIFELLKANPKHPSLHLKQIGDLWSVRVGKHFRALGLDKKEGIVWFWIGSHAHYDKIIS